MADVGKFTYNAARPSQKGIETINKGERTYTEEYTVVINGQKSPQEVTITGLPSVGEEKKIGGKKFKVTQITWSNSFPDEYWIATVQYKWNKKTSGDGGGGDEPSGGGKYVYKSFSPHAWNVDVEYDAADGRAVRNTAGSPFDQAITAQLYTTTITIKAREKSNPGTKISTYQGTINSDEIDVCGITIAPHCGLMTLAATETGEEDHPWEVTYTVMIARNSPPFSAGSDYKVNWDPTSSAGDAFEAGYDAGFDALVLNTGFSYLAEPETQGAERKEERFVELDKNGNVVPTPMPRLLDNSGGKAEDGQRHWCVFQRYPDADWSGLNLPDTDDPINEAPDDEEEEED